jgi:hypothetical protein
MPCGDCIRQFGAQIEIPAHALIVRAAKSEPRFGMGKVYRVFHFATPNEACVVKVGDFNSQALQVMIPLLKTA